MTLLPHLPCVALKRKPSARDTRAPRVLSIVGWFCRRPWQGSGADSVALDVCHLARVAARALLEGIGEVATSVIIRAPPLQMGEQLWSRLRCCPGSTSQCGSCVSDGQIHPLNTSGVQPSREAHPLEGGCESVLCSQTHHMRDANQLAPP